MDVSTELPDEGGPRPPQTRSKVSSRRSRPATCSSSPASSPPSLVLECARCTGPHGERRSSFEIDEQFAVEGTPSSLRPEATWRRSSPTSLSPSSRATQLIVESPGAPGALARHTRSSPSAGTAGTAPVRRPPNEVCRTRSHPPPRARSSARLQNLLQSADDGDRPGIEHRSRRDGRRPCAPDEIVKGALLAAPELPAICRSCSWAIPTPSPKRGGRAASRRIVSVRAASQVGRHGGEADRRLPQEEGLQPHGGRPHGEGRRGARPSSRRATPARRTPSAC